MTSADAPTRAVPRHITRGRRVSTARVAVVGVALAAALLAAALGAWELRLRRVEATRARDAARAQRAAANAGPPGRDGRARIPLMLVDEDTCYAGHAPRTEQLFEREGTPLRHRHVTDGDGFRVADPDAPHPGACRLLAVGDSFTSGVYVEAAQAWPALLEARLRARGYRVRVDNGGLQGHTIAQERVEVLCRWAALRPRVVVVGRSSNDVLDLAGLMESGCRVGGALPAELLPSLPEAAQDLRLVAGAMEARARLHVMTRRLREALRNASPLPDAPRCAAAEAAYVSEARDLARGAARAGARVLFAAFEHTSCGGAYTLQDGAAFERRLAAAVAEEGARSLDLKEALTPPGMRLTPWDGHPSPRGHEALAGHIAEHLAAGGWLEGCR